jgi:L-aspartate oxidase
MDFMFCHSLVIGGGIAGLRAAIELSRFGDVVIVNKGAPLEGSSGQAQGGVAVAIQDPKDIEIHFQDTLRAGKGLCREEAVRVLVEEGPQRIQELISWGACFDRIGEEFAFAKEGAHQKGRILRAKGDSTGEEMMVTLLNHVKKFPLISRMDNMFSMDLIIHDGRCIGATLLNQETQRQQIIFSRITVLATGGVGQLYWRTTNPGVATGDGMAMAARGGALLEDMEFVQFHPTSLLLPGAPPFLLSEAMRGEGAILRNQEGAPFMKKFHPDAEMAPRDVVARAIWQEMQNSGTPCVFLDVTHLSKDFIKGRFPKIYQTCLSYGLDIVEQMIPVAPSMHFMMGGMKVSVDGSSSVEGLFGAGEVACVGVHGANRLASNSLLEGLVFGKKVGDFAGQASENLALPAKDQLKKIQKTLLSGGEVNEISNAEISSIRKDLQQTMWEGIGIVRDQKGIERTLSFIQKWEWILKGTYQNQPKLELKNLLLLGKCISTASLLREESVGAHSRKDSNLRWVQSNCTVEVLIS